MRTFLPPTPPRPAPADDLVTGPGAEEAQGEALDVGDPEPVIGKVTHRFAVVNLERAQLRELGRLLRR
jgi:hypothetical protein